MRHFPVILLALGLCGASARAEVLETIAEWTSLNFAFPYLASYQDLYRPELTVPTGIEVGFNRIFLNIPRLRAGVPATLVSFPRLVEQRLNPQLEAYPSWEWHRAGLGDNNCSTLISTYRSRIDNCGRLWVLDAGVVTSIDDFTPVCSPKFMIFDLATDRLVRQYTFPRQSLRPNSLLTNFVIDDTKATGCDDVVVYITDTAGPGLLVYDAAKDSSWRFLHASMFPHPDFSMYTIGEDRFELLDGLIGLGLSLRTGTLFYHPLATNRLYSVPAANLRAGPPGFFDQLPVVLAGRKSSQSIALTVDTRDDSVVFAPLTETAIASWNPQTNAQRIQAQDSTKLQFVADVRNIPRDHDNLWALTTRFQKYFLRQLNLQQVNVRIMRLRSETPASAPEPRYIDRYELYPSFYNMGPNVYNNTVIY